MNTVQRATSAGRLADTVERLSRQVRAAQLAADGRGLIELAKGILVERLGCGPTEAARQLAFLANGSGLTQIEFAADIINEAAQDDVAELSRDFLVRATGSDDATPRSSAAVRMRTAESGALAAGDPQAAAKALFDHALAPLGAVAVALWTAGPDASLTLSGYAGFTTEEAARWRYVPPAVATAARRALEQRHTVWYGSLASSGLPSIGYRASPRGARMVVPAGTGGRLVGILEICWPEPRDEPVAAERRQIEALAELCAHTLDNNAAADCPGQARLTALTELIELVDGLHDPALLLAPQVDDTGQLTGFTIHHVSARFNDPAGRSRAEVAGMTLMEAYPVAAGVCGLYDVVERVHATGEPFRSEQMTLTSLVGQVSLTGAAGISVSRVAGFVVLVWRIDDDSARLARLLQHAQRLGRIGGFEEQVATGQVTWNDQLFELFGLGQNSSPIPMARLPEHAHPDDAATVGRFLRGVLHHRRPSSTAFRLYRPDGIVRHTRVVAEPVLDNDGSLLAVRGAYQDVSAQHWTEVALAATREQLAQTEQRAAERNRLALRLQHAIMPPAQGPIFALGLQVGVRYRPAEKEHLIGGDWYDAVVLPQDRVLLVVGDIAGHGIDAATGMLALRNALRGLAATGAGPAQLLTWLNLFTHHMTERVTATAVCGLYDPRDRTLRWARAGHLPPVLVRAGAAEALPLIRGMLLGAVSDAQYDESVLRMEARDTLLLYTDGLIERRNVAVEDSLRQLMRTAEKPDQTLDEQLNALLTFSNSDTDDDTCVVGIRHP
ncbi:SpoIIE family protein phosphatase [Pilimelia columellifera]|uniref:SpoIIE family protein phosphatase n=1 Tax=Pilimelia columellifera subsp. columellifera TaxID=706583 RepID=A0ABP6B3S3_9ACTN